MIAAALIAFIVGWYAGRAYEKTLWVHYQRVILQDGTAVEWDFKKKTWTKI